MVRFCLKPNSGSFVKLLLISTCFQTLVILSLIVIRKDSAVETKNEIFIEYRLMEGKDLIFSHRYKKHPGDLQFPDLEDIVTIDSNHIGIHPENIGLQYPSSGSDFQQLIAYHFQPILTTQERNLLLFTFQIFINLCQRHKLTYFLAYGSLLGSYRHHGMVPWDDDIDVFMNETEKRNVVLILGNVPGFELSHIKNYQWKFYPKFYKTLLFFQHRWPFVDIFFFAENSTHIWDNTTPSRIPAQPYNKDEVFPLVTRPFEGLFLLVPCDVINIIESTFSKYEWCESNYYWHKLERNAVPWRPRKIQCILLRFLYPFVSRTSMANDSLIVENLEINGRTIQTYEFKNQCEKLKK